MLCRKKYTGLRLLAPCLTISLKRVSYSKPEQMVPMKKILLLLLVFGFSIPTVKALLDYGYFGFFPRP